MRDSCSSKTPDGVVWRRVRRRVERVEPASLRRVLRAHSRWLREERHLSASSAEALVRVATQLLATWVGSETACVRAIRRLSPEEVDADFVRRRRGLSPGAREGLIGGSIRFLQFCMAQGWLPGMFLQEVPSLSPRRVPWTPAVPLQRTREAIARISPTSARRVLRSYVRWLTEVRQLAPLTIELRLRIARQLLTSWLGDETACVARLRRLGVDDVEGAFLRHRERGAGQSSQRHMQAGLRLFLRFCVAQRWLSPELVAAVPSMRTYRLSTVPRAVAESDMPALAAALRSPAISKRDRAIGLLLMTYGVRRGQIAALRLGDLDWRRRRVTFPPYKRGLTVQHMLTPAIAEALAESLRARPADCEVEQVFLRARAPYVGISPTSINQVVARIFKIAGIESRPRGPHAFRHAFAKRILAARKPFKTVADLLGHRSFNSTAIYAKVDVRRLREIPLEWPEVLR